MRALEGANAMFVLRRRDRLRIAFSAGLGLALVAATAFADEATPTPPASDPSFVKSVLKKANMATDDVGHPQDFVIKSRPSAPGDYVPVFRKNEEHKTKVLTPDQLKAMEAEMDAASVHNAQIRDAFPPARRAYQEEEREKAAKAAAKHAKTPATAAQ
jgi:hypothetical protein